jgi:nucleoside triphosphate pyrophosphatase
MAAPIVYLASNSPRRRELLAQAGVAHEVVAPDLCDAANEVDETPQPGEAPIAYVERVARAKAEAGWGRVRHALPARPLLAADTTVAIDGRILGKPETAGAAEGMLRMLSGRTHNVYTAVALAWQDRIDVALSESNVTMRALSEAEIARYVSTGEPMDKAGGYAVQGRAAIFIARIEGSYSGVMGLPLFETANLLAGAGLVLP